MDELDNCSNRYYHLEEILKDEIDLGKDCELIPVAHYTKVIDNFHFGKKNFKINLFRKMLFKSIYKNFFHFFSK
jgi:hypothetical protein